MLTIGPSSGGMFQPNGQQQSSEPSRQEQKADTQPKATEPDTTSTGPAAETKAPEPTGKATAPATTVRPEGPSDAEALYAATLRASASGNAATGLDTGLPDGLDAARQVAEAARTGAVSQVAIQTISEVAAAFAEPGNDLGIPMAEAEPQDDGMALAAQQSQAAYAEGRTASGDLYDPMGLAS